MLASFLSDASVLRAGLKRPGSLLEGRLNSSWKEKWELAESSGAGRPQHRAPHQAAHSPVGLRASVWFGVWFQQDILAHAHGVCEADPCFIDFRVLYAFDLQIYFGFVTVSGLWVRSICPPPFVSVGISMQSFQGNFNYDPHCLFFRNRVLRGFWTASKMQLQTQMKICCCASELLCLWAFGF